MGKDRFEDLDFIDFNDSRRRGHGDCRYAVGSVSQPEMVHPLRSGVCPDRFSVSEKFSEDIFAYRYGIGEG